MPQGLTKPLPLAHDDRHFSPFGRPVAIGQCFQAKTRRFTGGWSLCRAVVAQVGRGGYASSHIIDDNSRGGEGPRSDMATVPRGRFCTALAQRPVVSCVSCDTLQTTHHSGNIRPQGKTSRFSLCVGRWGGCGGFAPAHCRAASEKLAKGQCNAALPRKCANACKGRQPRGL